MHVENRVELGDLQQVFDPLGEIEQPELPSLVGHRGEAGNQLPNSRAVNIRDLAKVQQEFLMVFADHIAQGVAQGTGAFAQGDPAGYIDYRYVSNLSYVQLY